MSSFHRTLVKLIVMTGLGTVVAAQNIPHMVKEIDSRPNGRYGRPTQLTPSGGKLFFAAEDRDFGSEPWCTDGTPGGTGRLLDLFPGPGSSSPANFVPHAGGVFFTAADGVHGHEWWYSDGTAAGTRLVADATPGPRATVPVVAAVAGDRLFYFVPSFDLEREFELWTSDGTGPGTQAVAEGFTAPLHMSPCGDKIFFFHRGIDGSVELWTSDGSFAGTMFVDRVAGGNETAREAAVVGNRFFFITGGLPGYDAHEEQRLWTSDGTEFGTLVLRDEPLDSGGFVQQLVPSGDRLFFVSGDPVTHGEVWVTDGSVAGTRLVKDVVTGSGDDLTPQGLAAAGGGRVIFQKGAGLWTSDGSEAGTRLLSGFKPASSLARIVEGESAAYLQAYDHHRLEFYRVDGASGIVTFLPGAARMARERRDEIDSIAVGDDLYVASSNYQGSAESQLWRLPAGGKAPVLLRGFARGSGPVEAPVTKVNRSLAVLGDSVFFSAEPTPKGHELWSSDGTANGTRRLIGPSSWPLVDFESYGGKVYAIRDNVYKRQLVWTTGSARGSGATAVVPDSIISRKFMRAHLGGEVFHGPLNGTLPQKLMRTNGTSRGTRPVRPGEAPVVAPAEAHIFANSSPETGVELWICDGSREGTKLLADIYPGEISSLPMILGRVGNATFFTAFAPALGLQLYATEGTPETTRVVKNLSVHQYADVRVRSFIAYQGQAYFIGRCLNSHGLWKSDGTSDGTMLVKELAVNQDEIKTEEPCLTEVNGVLFFNARGEGGRELWKSDGSAEGTVRVADIRPGVLGSDPRNLYAAGGNLYFSADDGMHGFEVWTSDGTAEGTQLLADLTGDGQPSYPEDFTVCGTKLFFFARLPGVGRELHVLN